ncbi:MAG: M56 family metallopeptidase [Rhizomicrobium sp.]
MSDLLSMQILLAAGEAFAASSLIVALAWLAAARNTASQRHLVWFASFVALAALPLLATIVPSQITYMLAGPIVAVTQGFDPAMVAAPEPAGFTFDTATVVEMLIAAWLLGVVLIAVRGFIAAFALWNLRRNSVPHRFGHLAIEGPRCDLRLAQQDCGPMTWGIFRPVVLLPSDAEEWPRARLEAVLLHELAHVRRKDSLTQLASLAVCALYWPNPLVWLAAARLRREAETAADDAVLIAGVRPSAYAGALLQIASEFRVQRLSLPLAMAAPSALEARVKSVLAPGKSRSGVTKMDVFKIACMAAMATSAIVLARPSLAQDAPQVQATPLPPAAASPASPASTAAPAPEAQPASTDRYVIHAGDDHSYVIDDLDGPRHVRHWRDLTPQERTRIQAQVHRAMAKAGPAIERAMRDSHAAEAAVRAVEATRPQIEAAMAEAMRSTHEMSEAQIQAAIAKARIALAHMPNEAEIDAKVQRAMAKAQAQLAAVRVKMHDRGVVTDDGDDDMNGDGPDVEEPPMPPAPEAAPPAPSAVTPAAPVPPQPQN